MILAPHGRDASIAAELLARNEITSCICSNPAELVERLTQGADAVLLTEETLVATPEFLMLAQWVANQPVWSDIPFVVLANGSRTPRSVAATERLSALGNVVLLERPLHAEAMIGAVRSSLKARARQYEARDAALLSDAQNRILELVVEEAPLNATLEAIVLEVEALSKSGVIASILLLDEDKLHLRHGAGPNLPQAYNKAIDGIEIGPNAGSCGTAVYRNESVFVSDIAQDPLWADFRELAVRHGLRACWSLPIRSVQGEILGTFAMYHREPRVPVTADLAIVDFVVRTAGIVIARARTETSLRASEARYRQIVEGAEDFAIVTLDGAGIITGWNSGAEHLVGYSIEEALGQAGGLFFTEEDKADQVPERELQKALAEGRAVNERWQFRKDGSRFWGSGLTMPLADGHGGFVKIFRDRTSEHEAEAALRISESHLRFFGKLEERLFSSTDASAAMHAAASMLGQKLDVSRCAYADVDTDGDRFWIRSDFTAPGVATSAGIYSLDLFGPRAADDMRQGKVLVVRNVTDELAPGEGRETFHAIGVEAIICCPLIRDGQLASMMAVHQTVPREWTSGEIALVREVVDRCWAHVQRVGAEARLRESEERLRLAVENAEIGFWDVDVINDRLIWPPQTKAMFGISADVAVTMDDFYAGLHPQDHAATTAAYLAAADPEKRALYDVEYRTVGKEDGIERWVAAKGRGVFDNSGRCVRIAGTALDITIRKQAEEALLEFNATLERRIAEAVAEREQAHEALRQSQKMDAMGQLTGGVAHDFNNLLTPIVGSLDMLQRRGVGNEREQILIAGAVQSAERARLLVQRLLAFARRQPLQAVSVDISKLVAGMGDLVESTTGPQIKVIVNVASDLPPVKADPNQLEMALLNLAVNARDAMVHGGTLEISATPETIGSGHQSGAQPGSYVRLCIADTGTGMDKATIARAVEPFFSTKGIGKGTGLGLSSVHGLMAQLGGALTINSRPGTGTNVELWLPVSQHRAQQALAPRAGEEPLAHRGLALLVDDEELVRISTADMLTELGYAVVEAASGEEAVQLIDRNAFDVLITDHLMTGMNGTDLAMRVKASRPDLKVLLVSGYAETEGVDADLPRLTKPFRKNELSAALSALAA